MRTSPTHCWASPSSLAIFAAGVLGAVLISGDNGLALPIVMIALAIIAFSVVAGAAFSLPLAAIVSGV